MLFRGECLGCSNACAGDATLLCGYKWFRLWWPTQHWISENAAHSSDVELCISLRCVPYWQSVVLSLTWKSEKFLGLPVKHGLCISCPLNSRELDWRRREWVASILGTFNRKLAGQTKLRVVLCCCLWCIGGV